MGSLDISLFSRDAGVWVSFLFSLMIFSAILGNVFIARLAQYILVGVTLGYLAALTLRHILLPRLFTPLLHAPLDEWRLWGIVVLGVLLLVSGVDLILTGSRRPGNGALPLWRQAVRLGGAAGVALMLGVSVAVALIGMLQGTLWPQFFQAARSGFDWLAPVGAFGVSILLPLLTIAALLYWVAPRAENPGSDEQYPVWVQALLRGWRGVGKRMLWFAAGVIFARLLAAHLSLLISRIQFFLFSLNETHLWQWAEAIWQALGGG